MPVESWMNPEDVPALAADATAQIDSILGRLPEADRDAFWMSIRKCYNTPYNDPKPRPLPVRDVIEACATRPHTASMPELPAAGIGFAASPPVELDAVRMDVGAILGGPSLAAEAHPA